MRKGPGFIDSDYPFGVFKLFLLFHTNGTFITFILLHFSFQPEPGIPVLTCPFEMFDGDQDRKHDEDGKI
jgi:hypothetical protein